MVGLVASAISAVLIAGMITGYDASCCVDRHPYVRLYDGDRTQLEAFLVTGDAQAFAALAQDPMLAHPEHIDPPEEYAYRAQRPVWGYLGWATSLGQPQLAGWALVALSIVAAGALASAVAALSMRRGAAPWWGMVALVAGFQPLQELTPELLAAALVGGALLCGRERRVPYVGFLTVAALTRESMLVAVAMLAAYEVVQAAGPLAPRVRAVLPLAIPFAAYAGWAIVLQQRLGGWPWQRSDDRLVAPFTGIVEAWTDGATGATIGFVVACVLCGGAWALARRDVLTWIASGYLLFATTFSADVWLRGGFERSLVPLYVFGTIAVVGGLHARRRPPVCDDALVGVATPAPDAMAGAHTRPKGTT